MSSIKKEIVQRFTRIYIVVIVIAIAIFLRILYLQFIDNERWVNKSKTMAYKDMTIESSRGDICAVDGRVLASSVPFYEIRMDLKSKALKAEVFENNLDSLATCLANLFTDTTKKDYMTKAQYIQDLRSARTRGEGYHLIKRKVSFGELKQMKKFPIFNRGRFKGGFIVIQENIRNKPFKNLAARTIGRLAKADEKAVIVGIEGAYNQYLKGSNGLKLAQRLSGNVWMPVETDNELEPQDGNDVISTIDINIQDVTHNALLKCMRKHKAHHGTAIVMEVETGEIRAISNLGDTANYHEYYNFGVAESVAPGSTFKLASVMALLEDGAADLLDSVDTEDGTCTFFDFTIRDSHKGGYGVVTLQEAFELSSNVGIAKVVNRCYKDHPERFIERLYSFNLNNKNEVDLLGEGTPKIKYPGEGLWSNVSLPQMSIGYELRMTPLQVLTFYNAIANNGKMVKPIFVTAIRDRSSIIKKFSPVVLKASICSDETIDKVKRILEGVVERGTAKNIKNDNYKIAGKTGTAKIYDINKKAYVNRYRASFVGYFPADRPKYSCIVVINKPIRGSYYGSAVAAPVFKEIADKIYATDLKVQEPINKDDFNYNTIVDIPYSKTGFKDDLDFALNYLGVPKQYYSDVKSDWVFTQSKPTYVEYKNRNVSKSLVPLVIGMGARDALSVLENNGLSVKIIGRGKVTQQSIPAGTAINQGDEIVLTMSILPKTKKHMVGSKIIKKAQLSNI